MIYLCCQLLNSISKKSHWYAMHSFLVIDYFLYAGDARDRGAARCRRLVRRRILVRNVVSSTFAADKHHHSRIRRRPGNGAESPLKILVFLQKGTLHVLLLDEIIKRELLLANAGDVLAGSVVNHQFLFRSLLCHFLASRTFDHTLSSCRYAFGGDTSTEELWLLLVVREIKKMKLWKTLGCWR